MATAYKTPLFYRSYDNQGYRDGSESSIGGRVRNYPVRYFFR